MSETTKTHFALDYQSHCVLDWQICYAPGSQIHSVLGYVIHLAQGF